MLVLQELRQSLPALVRRRSEGSRATFLALGLAMAAVGVACSGQLSDPGGDGGDDEGTPETTGQAGGGGSMAPLGAGGGAGAAPRTNPSADLACPSGGTPKPGTSPLRRLTAAEYDATVRDLLGSTTKPSTQFPAESLEHGFGNNVKFQTPSFTQSESYFKAAESLANAAMPTLDKLVVCDQGEDACAKSFVTTFGQRAFRRPLTPDEVTSFLATYKKGRASIDYKNGLRFVVTRMLNAPSFLYRPEFGVRGSGPTADIVRPSSWEMASRLSYLFLGSMPDATLFEAAAKDELKTDAQIAAQATRLLKDARARDAVARFYAGWFRLDKLAKTTKDGKLFPGFADVQPKMAEEITRLADDVIWTSGGKIRDLFTANYSFMDKTLATYVGLGSASTMGTAFQRVPLDAKGAPGAARRAGLLTTAGILAAQSKPFESSPIYRGKFVVEQFLCVELPTPPADVPPLPAGDTSNQTTRERLEEHLKSDCASCHRVMDPVGFTFENFDAVGRWRATEKSKPINAQGTLKTGTDVDGAYTDFADLLPRFADSRDVRSCAARQWFRFATGRGEEAGDDRSLAQLSCQFQGPDANLQTLFAGFAQTDAFRFMPAPAGGASP